MYDRQEGHKQFLVFKGPIIEDEGSTQIYPDHHLKNSLRTHDELVGTTLQLNHDENIYNRL